MSGGGVFNAAAAFALIRELCRPLVLEDVDGIGWGSEWLTHALSSDKFLSP